MEFRFHIHNFQFRKQLCLLIPAFGFISMCSSQDIPSISQIVLPEVKRFGMTGYLNCTVYKQNHNKVFWIRNGVSNEQNLVITSNDRVVVDDVINELVEGKPKFDVYCKGNVKGQMTYTLVINRLIFSDTGNYTCMIDIVGTTFNPSTIGQLLVLVPPSISVSNFQLTLNVVEGNNVSLFCSATGYPPPNITWCRVNGNPLPHPHNKFVYHGSTLTLTNIQPLDRSMYRCVANNDVRPMASYDTTIYVLFKPTVSLIQDTYGQAANRQFQLSLYCIISGWPAPIMNWYKEEGDSLKLIIDDDFHQINQMQSHSQVFMISEMYLHLTIINIQANDYGYYVCQGSNKLGTGRGKILVYETSECQGPNCPMEGGTLSNDAILIISNKCFAINLLIFCFSKLFFQ